MKVPSEGTASNSDKVKVLSDDVISLVTSSSEQLVNSDDIIKLCSSEILVLTSIFVPHW